MDLALKVGAPLIGLNDGAGARIQEGPVSLASYGGIFHRNVLASGRHPADQRDPRPVRRRRRVLPRHDRLHLHGEGALAHVHHRPRRREDGDRRGGHARGARRRHVARLASPACAPSWATTRRSCSKRCATSSASCPSNNLEEPPHVATADDPNRECPELRDLMPASPNIPYDMKTVIAAVVDDGDYVEYFPHWAGSITCGFARIDGHPVGIVGNQPMVLAGVLDINSAEKAARFVRTCDAFNIPLVTFVDVPGFLPGVDQEYGGIIRHGAKLLYAYCEATVPAHPDHHPQGLRRRLRGDELEVDRRRPRLRLAVRRAGRDGPAGRRRDRVPQGAQQRRRPDRQARRAGRRVHRAASATPTSRPSAASSTTSSTRPRPASSWSPASSSCAPSARSSPSASTATCRCDGRRDATSPVGAPTPHRLRRRRPPSRRPSRLPWPRDRRRRSAPAPTTRRAVPAGASPGAGGRSRSPFRRDRDPGERPWRWRG